ncbi:hypothetical protein [Anaerotruncus colihominis]|uniref:hypothetical protein n=1 Tax=Anaerotruncus colihominis TaxID=169435 RepID=UPI00189BC6D3|nr:hypothetical protein [Anaerotruncus colihominis]
MEIEAVLEQFMRLSGLDEQAAREWTPLCEAAAERIEELLPADADPNRLRLILAAAGEANYRYMLARSTGNAQSFKVGDISVTRSEEGGSAQEARALRDALFADAAPLFARGHAGLWQVMERESGSVGQ